MYKQAIVSVNDKSGVLDIIWSAGSPIVYYYVRPLNTSYGSHFLTFQSTVSSLKNVGCEDRVPLILTL